MTRRQTTHHVNTTRHLRTVLAGACAGDRRTTRLKAANSWSYRLIAVENAAITKKYQRGIIIILIIIIITAAAGRPHIGPWKGGKPLAWDVTAVCTVADSYVAATAREAGAAAEREAELKISKYSGLEDKLVCLPANCSGVAWSTHETACQFLKDLGRRISTQSGDERERVPFCSKGYLLPLSDSTLSCSTTVLRRQTTWANGHSSVYIF